ncbi:MAG: PAS domain-containing protein [Candidatus Eisenbacteria sp.]|nr:PAS domain-containing protein [Candidatus Eisenbacteria bacterium]
MTDATLLAQVLDSFTDPLLVADTEHTVVYVNNAAADHYTGGDSLMGTSLLDCHNEHPQEVMIEVLATLQSGEEERLISDDEKRRIYTRAVRDEAGDVVRYYERYEWKAA